MEKGQASRMKTQKYPFFIAFSTSSFPVMDTITPDIPGIFPTQGSNPGLPHGRQMLLAPEPPGKPLFCKEPLNLASQERWKGWLRSPRTRDWTGQASDARQGQRAGLKANGMLRLLDAYQVPRGSHLIVSLPSHYEMRIETSSKTGSNTNVDGRELDMSPQTKCGGRQGGAMVNGTPPHLYLGAGHTSWGAMLHLRSILSKGTGGGFLPPPNTSAAQDKRWIVSPLLTAGLGILSATPASASVTGCLE